MIWFLTAPLSIVMMLFAMILAPQIACFAQKDGWLPKWLSWFQTPDNPIIGDELFHKNQMSWTTDPYVYAVFWLWRNPSYGFDFLIGAKIKEGYVYRYRGNEMVGNDPLTEGWLYRTVNNVDGTKYWQFLAVYKLTSTKCLKVNLGWKLWRQSNPSLRNLNGRPSPNGLIIPDLIPGQTRQLVCTINPFTKFVV